MTVTRNCYLSDVGMHIEDEGGVGNIVGLICLHYDDEILTSTKLLCDFMASLTHSSAVSLNFQVSVIIYIEHLVTMSYCNNCGMRCQTERGDEGFICCTNCGRVIDSDMFSSEPTFIKGPGGQSQLSGKFVKSVENGCSESRQRTLDKGRDEISYLVENLNISGGNSIIDQASAFYRIAVDRNFTRGRRTSLVAAACLYIACRENKKAYLLIDFSEDLRVNVYVLGAVFLQLCQLLRLEEHPIVQKLVDPSLFIHRFTERLLGGKNDKVSRTALRILASMKRDWMQTGRKPSGLCGAALYISAHSYGLRCSKYDIGTVVHICEATLTKRLIEFENTESGSLTIEEFNTKAEEIERESGSKQLANVGVKSSGAMELLCEHKGLSIPHFAHGLCRGCYDDFVELSGGLLGGSDPPAFQRAERERMARESALEKAKGADVCQEDVDPLSLPNYDSNQKGKVDPQQSEAVKLRSQRSEGVSNGVQDVDGSVYGNGNADVGDVTCDEEESLSDIDDAEVCGYLHDEDEKRLKTIIWETLNKEYLEEEAAKQAAKEALEAKFEDGSEDSLHARELARQALDNVAKSRKEKRRQRALEAKNAPPAQNATEAAHQMLKKKKLSSRINYAVLEKLLGDDDPMSTDDTKKRQKESNSDDNTNSHKRIKESESDIMDDSNSIAQKDMYGECPMYGEEDVYLEGNEDVDYGYGEDYGEDY